MIKFGLITLMLTILKLDKKSVMNINIYYIGYVTKKTEYNIDSVNPFYLFISELDGSIDEKMVIST